MPVDFFHKEFRTKYAGFPDLLRVSTLVRPGLILGKGGELMATFSYRGPDMQCASQADLDSLRMRVADMIKSLQAGWMIHSTTLRKESLNYSNSAHFPHAATRAIEAERMRQYSSEGNHYENDFFITFTYWPDLILVNKIKEFAYDSNTKSKANPRMLAKKAIEYFERTLSDLTGKLEVCLSNKLVRLAGRTIHDPVTHREILVDDQLTFMHECLTGNRNTVRLPKNRVPVGLDSIIGSYSFYPGIRPKFNGKFIRVVAIESPPDEGTYFGILDVLNRMPVQFRWTTRWIASDPDKTKVRFNRIRSKWRQKIRGFIADMTGRTGGAVDADAANMAADVEDAMTDINSNAVAYGFWTSTVVLTGNDPSFLEASVKFLIKSVGATGFVCRDEDDNCTDAFLGSIPGHGFENVRRPEIHSVNLADSIPLTSVWQGPDVNPCPLYQKYFGNEPIPPLMTGAASGGTPFRVVLHNGDVGHTFIGGPTGAGKSTLLCMIAASHFRYPEAKFYAFDKGESMLALCLAERGNHYNFMDESSAESMSIGFAPFAMVDKIKERIWAVEYVTAILELNKFTVDIDIEREVTRAMELLATRPRNMRSFTDLAQLVQTRKVREILSLYESDRAGGMLNAREDTISTSRFTVFEMEHLLGMGDVHVVPVLLYLFRMIERGLTGEPAIICLDEAWVVLQHPMFEERLKQWFKVLRKQNCLVIFATQELQDVANSAISSTIFSSCQTKILLPNAAAEDEDNARLYRKIGLSDREIQLLRWGTPKRDYFFTSPGGRRMFQLELGDVALAFVAASGVSDRVMIKELYKSYGDGWVAHWLRHRGVDPAVLQ